jgi:hypothetical protein
LGEIVLGFPYNAGYLRGKSCTILDVFQTTNLGGGIQLGIKTSQKPFCPVLYGISFWAKPRTNANTSYVFEGSGNRIRLTGTVGGMASLGPGTTKFALSSGSAIVQNCKGKTASIVAGQQAIASPQGVVVSPAVTPAFTISGGKVQTHPDNNVMVNGRETRQLGPGSNKIEVRSLSGATDGGTYRQWPKGVWRPI